MEAPDQVPEGPISRQVKHLIWATGVLAILLALEGFGGWVMLQRQRADDARGRIEARVLLCRQLDLGKAFDRTSARKRLAEALAFRKEHPRGIDGISATLILNEIHSAKAALKVLRPVDCEAFGRDPTKIVYLPLPKAKPLPPVVPPVVTVPAPTVKPPKPPTRTR